MKTIEEVRFLIGSEFSYYISQHKVKPLPWGDFVDKILSIVIGEDEKKCSCIITTGKTTVRDTAYIDVPSPICETCQGTGKIKHPITIRDAIEYERKEVKP